VRASAVDRPTINLATLVVTHVDARASGGIEAEPPGAAPLYPFFGDPLAIR
jgi:hypothetical protein